MCSWWSDVGTSRDRARHWADPKEYDPYIAELFLDAPNYYISSQHEFLWWKFLNVHSKIFLPFRKKHFLLHVSWVLGGKNIVDNNVFVILLNTFSRWRCGKSRPSPQQRGLLSYCSFCTVVLHYSNGASKPLKSRTVGKQVNSPSLRAVCSVRTFHTYPTFVQTKHSCPTSISMYLQIYIYIYTCDYLYI